MDRNKYTINVKRDKITTHYKFVKEVLTYLLSWVGALQESALRHYYGKTNQLPDVSRRLAKVQPPNRMIFPRKSFYLTNYPIPIS